jgi:Zn-dependent protease
VRCARAAALPLDAWSWWLVLAFPAGIGLFLGLWLLRVGPVDEYGNYPLAFVSGTIVATVLFAGALARIGRWLSNEDPSDEERLINV